MFIRSLIVASVLVSSAVTAQPTTVQIETISLWDQKSAVDGIDSQTGVRSLGQTFLTPYAPGVALTGFSLFLGGPYTEPLRFKAYVMAWDEALFRPVGSVLWESGATAGPPTPPAGASWPFQKFDFAFGADGLPLNGGSRYLFLLSTAETSATKSPAGALLGLLNDPPPAPLGNGYSGGSFVYLGNSSRDDPPPFATGNSWTQLWNYGRSTDLAFAATFNVVPEPSTYALLSFGLLAIGIQKWRRRS
jgi:PEP-CTERM motif